MKNILRSGICTALIVCLCASCVKAADDFTIKKGEWEIYYGKESKTMDFKFKGETILAGVYLKAKEGETMLESKSYPQAALTTEQINDERFGAGKRYTVRYTGNSNAADLKHVFYLYDEKEYLLVEGYVESDKVISSNYIAPLYSETRSTFLPNDGSNKVLSVPFDNDAFVRYSAFPMQQDSVSFEVTAIYNATSRKGLVVGSIEHDNWKTGVRYSTTSGVNLDKLECYGGITHKLTRDIDTGKSGGPTSKEHGSLSGNSVKSPLMLVGLFDDWRKGLEHYGDANALIAPPRTWATGVPFGWNSWGAMETKVNPQGVMDVSDFIKNELSSRSFENNGLTFIGLDSYWNENFAGSELRNFVKHCNANGQEAGIYWCPFSDWGSNGERYVEGTNRAYRYNDAYLYADGKIRSVESRCMDPTHPATKMRMADQVKKFKDWGFKYIKLDFINNGTCEADSFYEEGITTGVQAYNHGMQYLVDLCGDDIYLALSIAPTFPAQYGHSKRISCDAWGAMVGEWGSTEYMLNSLSFGWWLDRVYTFNDADHLVLYDEASNKKYRENENRARITSGVITGIYMLGDNYSRKGTLIGTEEARNRALKYATNADINEIARCADSFYPLEGNRASKASASEDVFTMETEEYIYCVVFNFSPINTARGSIDLSRLNTLQPEITAVKELWSGEEVTLEENKLPYLVPLKDVKVYRLTKKSSGSSIAMADEQDNSLNSYVDSHDNLVVESDTQISGLQVFSSAGKMLLNSTFQPSNNTNIHIGSLPDGMYMLLAKGANNLIFRNKFMK
ncbi:T9SS type A sorting domain-containing protein [Parabacteroides sp. OttesenSCG-928-N08]|nr:T9SS type A sorting domain-containing protein [Parabacteroides sp. OttesenSCG-928-N08]